MPLGADALFDDQGGNWSISHAVDVPVRNRITLGVYAKHAKEC